MESNSKKILKTSSVRFAYNGKSQFTFPDIELNEGENCLLLGNSGCGKTTLLHLIGGLLRSQSGVIDINGANIVSMEERDLDKFRGKNVGFVFQKNHLIPSLTVKENLLMPAYLNRTEQQSGQVDYLLHRLDLIAEVNSSIRSLSHGQLQRVAIARAIINRPHLILADEPTSALDDDNCARVISLLLEIVREYGSTLLIATHDQRLKSVIPKQLEIYQ